MGVSFVLNRFLLFFRESKWNGQVLWQERELSKCDMLKGYWVVPFFTLLLKGELKTEAGNRCGFVFFFLDLLKAPVVQKPWQEVKSFWGFQTHSFSDGMCLWSCRTFPIQQLTLFCHPIPCPFLVSVESRYLARMICGAQSLFLSWEVSPWTKGHQEEFSFFKLPILESLLSCIVVCWVWWL